MTQFEGTYARMMFPCFDEPSFKATFDLTVEISKGDTAISNGKIISDKPAPGDRHTIRFSTSPKMSTYLMALAVGDWQCLGATVDGTPIRVCAVPEKKAQAQFALEAAKYSVHFYNNWFGIHYPFEKLDMLAIPDYEWGGMENAGSIFYRDTALLLDEATASAQGRRRRATVAAHEIAHQWFGDFVTAAWWDDIWLNEGFATWMETKPIEAWHPEWHLEDDDAESAQKVISTDSLGATRAIHGDPKNSSEIKEMFDGITYQKGGAVLSMLEAWVGPDAFRKGAADYLRAHANSNATASDFWQAMAKSSGKPVDQIMPGFVMQPGVPVVSLKATCVANETRIEASQQQFFLSPEKKESTALWQIPLCTKAGCTLMTERNQVISQGGCGPFVYGNRDAKGYYRVAYSAEDLKAIAGAAETSLNAPERIALIEDTWAMVRAGRAPVGQFLDLSRSMKAEADWSAVDLLAEHLQYLSSLAPTDRILRDQFTPLASQLGWEAKTSDTEQRKALRADLLGVLGGAGDPGAIAKAREIAESYLKSPASVEGSIASEALRVAAQYGDLGFYTRLNAEFARASDSDTANVLLFALAAFRDPALVQRTIGLIDSGKVREDEYPRLFNALLSNGASRDVAWTYMKAHWDKLAEQVTSFGGAGAVAGLGNFCTAASRDDVETFFKTHTAPGAQRTLRQSIERMNNCIEFRSLQQANMEAWLSK